MKIAVVGGKGFIGKEFVSFVSKEGHESIVVDSSFDAFSGQGRKLITEKISGCEALVFLAARRPKGTFGLEDYLYNIELTGTYLDLCRDIKIANVVLASSRSVYSSDKIPWKESELDRPLSLYGASKQAADCLALLYNKEYDMHIKSLRLAQVLGLGERKGYLLNTLIDNAIEGKVQTIYGKGIGKRQYVYVKDVCDAILHCAVNKKELSGIFNIGMSENISVKELARLINDVFENKSAIDFIDYDKEDINEYLMDVSKATNELQWTAKFDMKKALQDIRNDVKKDLK